MRILVTGASGQLGAFLLDELIKTDHAPIAWSGTTTVHRGPVAIRPVDLADPAALAAALDAADPDAILHAGAISQSAAVHRDPHRAEAVNVDATRQIADWSARNNRRLVFTSTDLVFDGNRGMYREDDPAEPVLAYGRTKRRAEGVVTALPLGLVARLSLLYGPKRGDRDSFFDRSIASIRTGVPQSFFADEFRTPLDYPTAARALVLLAADPRATGLLHLGGPERMSRHDLMRRAAIALGLDPSLVVANLRSDALMAEPRPADVSLDTTRLAALLPDLSRPTVEAAVTASR